MANISNNNTWTFMALFFFSLFMVGPKIKNINKLILKNPKIILWKSKIKGINERVNDFYCCLISNHLCFSIGRLLFWHMNRLENERLFEIINFLF